MSITVAAEIEAKIRERVENGQYAIADEVIGEALRLLDEHERLQSLRAAVAEGLERGTVPLTRASWMEAWERAKKRAGIADMHHEPSKPADASA